MKNRIILAGVLSALAFTGVATATGVSGSGTLGVSADVSGSILMTFTTDASGIAVTGTGSSLASLPFSNVQMYGGSVPGNVTKTLTGITAFTLATPFDIEVDIANTPSSTTFTLAAILTSGDAVNTYTVNGVTILSTTGGSPITITGGYGTATSYAFNLVVPASAAAGSISNTLSFTATSN